MQKISILIADSHLLFRQSFSLFLEHHGGFNVVGETNSMAGTIELYHKLSPQIVLIDIDMHDTNRFELLKFIRSASVKPRIIAMASHIYPEQALQVMSIGVMGFITKHESSQELITAIMDVSRGNRYICKEMQDKAVENILNHTVNDNKIDTLTKKEMDIVSLVQNGYTSKQMAEKLELSRHTIMVHRYKILKKLNLKNAASLVNFIHYNYS